MKRITLFMVIASFFMVACAEKSMRVEIKNDTPVEKINEIIGVSWKDLNEKLSLKDEKSFVILNELDGKEIAHQVIYNGNEIPQEVIFLTTLVPGEKIIYKIKPGIPREYQKKTFGRAVPERKDDFAWENDQIAFRMYGPALAAENASNGVDVWLKKTNDLIVDKFYNDELKNKLSYHVDRGLGLDCYKVGHTLGAGGIAPYIDTTLFVGGNYTTAKLLDSGPLRTCFELTYDSVPAPGKKFSQKMIVSLDAGSQLNKAVVSYNGDFETMQVAGGIWLHKEIGNILENREGGYIAYGEKAVSDAGKDAGRNYIAVIFPKGVMDTKQQNEHLLAIADYKKGEEITYYFGAGWNQWGFDSDEAWFDYVKKYAEKLKYNLTITILK